MYTSRRNFIKKSALAIAASTFASRALFAAKPGVELVGLQLYSVRTEMKSDPLGTLKQISAMGYKHVEHANYVDRKFYGYGAKEFKKILSDLGMDMPSGHTVLGGKHWDAAKKDFTDVWKYTVEDAAIVGQEFVISPSLEKEYWKSADDLKGFMEVFNKSGELCKKSGMKFGYHNHDFEFSQKLEGTTMFDIILTETDPALVIQQIDIGNLYNGGAKALDVMTKYPGRFQSMHVKDEIASSEGNEKYESTILGKGIVPVKEVIDLGRKSGGTKHFIIEQESYQGKTPISCMKENLEAMKKWGYK
ncbi:TIM barrel protein [Chryseolinea sp. H1M3-3]|uniref:sugar phosphate isomerase/epimerase family protein n=1 Tax=Chryseolinea sp. H1M3-3 TaxID=3034144 RepID=UPI0023EBF229|nr:TIM barrel protein [Chryseolinea sp. H1M3-3]